jgi:hypothetical protein
LGHQGTRSITFSPTQKRFAVYTHHQNSYIRLSF